MNRRFFIALPAVAALGLLAACRAPEDVGRTSWQRPETDEAQQLKDERECRRRAESEVERDVRRDRLFSDDGIMRPGSYDSMMSRHEAARRIERLTADCLRRRGYAPAAR